MRGRGFPGWGNAGSSLCIVLLMGGGGAFFCWRLAHEQRDWSSILAIIFSLLDLSGMVLVGLAATVVALFAIAGVYEWSTTYLIRSDAGAIIVEFQRFWGLVRDRRELPTAGISEVTTRMAGAAGDDIVTDISLRLEGGPVKVFRSRDPTEVEMLVIYLNAACGRHAGAGTAAHISEQWAAMKATIASSRGKGTAALPPPAGHPPAP